MMRDSMADELFLCSFLLSDSTIEEISRANCIRSSNGLSVTDEFHFGNSVK